MLPALKWFFVAGTHRTYHGNMQRNAFSPFGLVTLLGFVTTLLVWGVKCI